MKREFPGYYRPTTAEFDTLWAEALFVVDANVLLHVYGYSSETRESLLKILEGIKGRIWIPHQFAAEYQRPGRGFEPLRELPRYGGSGAETRTDIPSN